MRRREFIALIGGAMIANPTAGSAQQAGRVFRVGLIAPSTSVAAMAGPNPTHASTRAFLHGLRDLGYLEGVSLTLERRSAEGKFERFGEIATELLERKVDVIVTIGNEMANSVGQIVKNIPIVMANSTEPVEAGIVASLARPGGNITGLAISTGPEFEAKRLQLLTEVVPEARRIAFLGTKDEWESAQGASLRSAAPLLGVTVMHAEHTPSDYARAFATMTKGQVQAIFLSRHAAHIGNQRLILDFVANNRLPGMFNYRDFVDAGGLMSYGVNLPDLFRRAAGYVDKILKGSKPDELPVEQPTKFEMVINMKTAQSLGLAISPVVLAQANEVIE
jgi:putative tryptophan/tyrosine transport system substrate-binding protein